MTDPFAAIAPRFGVWLLRTSWEASVLIALVFALRFALRRWLTPRWQYALWLLVVARLALPSLPASPTSVFNLERIRLASPAEPAMPVDAPRADVSLLGPSTTSADHPVTAWVRRLPSILFAGWALVAAFLLARLAVRSYRLTSRVCRQRPVTRRDVVELLEDCKQEMGVHIPINVVQSAEVATPALLGFLRPRLLLPERLLETFDRDALRLLFLHELAHVKRSDILVNWIATLLHVMHWFNPLLAFAMARMRADRELATDSLVLSHRGEADNLPYGNTLIRLVEFAAHPGLLPGAVGVLEDKAELKRRVAMIATHRRNAYGRSALAAGLLIVLGATTLTGSSADTSGRPADGTFSGSVEDSNGVAMNGATVTAIEKGGTKYTTKSQDGGAYTLTVPIGTYVLEAEAPGMALLTEPIALSSGQSAQRNLRLVGAGPEHTVLHWREAKSRKDLAGDAARLRSGKTSGAHPARLFEELSKALPDFVWLSSLEQSGNIVVLKGTTNALPAIVELVTNLQKSGAFPAVDLVGTTEQGNKVGFEIKTTFVETR